MFIRSNKEIFVASFISLFWWCIFPQRYFYYNLFTTKKFLLNRLAFNKFNQDSKCTLQQIVLSQLYFIVNYTDLMILIKVFSLIK